MVFYIFLHKILIISRKFVAFGRIYQIIINWMMKVVYLTGKIISCILVFLLLLVSHVQSVCAQTGGNQRLGGEDRYGTAVEISREGWEKSFYAVIAGSENIADVLCSVPLAFNLEAPILLAGQKTVPAVTLNELARLGVKHVFLIGGPQAVDPIIENVLKAAGIQRIERLAGVNRYETAAKTAERLNTNNGIVLVSGQTPCDALAFSSLAAQKGLSFLYTEKNNLPFSVKALMQKYPPPEIYLIGSEETVGKQLETYVKDFFSGKFVWIGGNSRLENNYLFLKYFRQDLHFERIFAATGKGSESELTDALCAAVIAAKTKSPLILTDGTIPKETAEYLRAQISSPFIAVAVGGETALPGSVLAELKEYVEKYLFPEKTASNNAGHGMEDDVETLLKVTGISFSKADGLYKVGDIIEIIIEFDGEVVVTGIPALVLETGENDSIAWYSGGTDSNRLVFRYEVRTGDIAEELDYKASNALLTSDATIKEKGTSRGVDLMLPLPGGVGSLADSGNIMIDGAPPCGILINDKNILAGNSGLTLTAINGPLSVASWLNILSQIRNHTTDGTWIRGIKSSSLSISPISGGAEAVVGNNSPGAAVIASDFIIPAEVVTDTAGNSACTDIIIDSWDSNVTDLKITDFQVVSSLNNTIGGEDIYIASERTVDELKNSLAAKDNSLQTYIVRSSGNSVKIGSETLVTGDRLGVTAENGLTYRIFPVRVAP